MTSYIGPGRLAEPVPFDPTVTNQWGAILNSNFTLVQDLITGYVQVNIAGLTTYTLTASNGAADQSRPLIQSYTGALTADCTVTMPNLARVGYAANNTTGGHNVILKCGAGSTVTISPGGAWSFYQVDGAGDVILPALSLQLEGSVASLSVGNLTVTDAMVAPEVTVTTQLVIQGVAIIGGTSSEWISPVIFASNVTFDAQCNGDTLTFGIGTFSGSCTAGAFITSSDYRLKYVYGPASAGYLIDNTPVHDAAFKDKPWDRRPMFLAHELPDWAVHGQKDAVDITGAIIPQQIDMPSLVPVLWAEVAALRRRVAELEKK